MQMKFMHLLVKKWVSGILRLQNLNFLIARIDTVLKKIELAVSFI